MTLQSTSTKGPYSFFLDDRILTSTKLEDLDRGTYHIMVEDGYGCKNSTEIEVSGPDSLNLRFDITHPTCQKDGSILAYTEGGSGPYNYLWSNMESSNLLLGLRRGKYSLTVTDASNCELAGDVELEAPNYPEFDNVVVNNVTCYDGLDGSVSFNINGGTGPKEVSLVGADAINLDRYDELGSGRYQVIISDSLSCTTSIEITIEEPQIPSAVIYTSEVSCYGEPTGVLEVDFQNLIEPVSALWVGERGQVYSGQNIEGVEAGQYTLRLSDSSSCILMDSALVEGPESPLDLSWTIEPPSCNKASDASLTLHAKGGLGPYLYSDGGEIMSVDSIFSFLRSGIHKIAVQDLFGCEIEVENILIPAPPAFTIQLDFDTIVYKGEDVEITINLIDPVGSPDFMWITDPPGFEACDTCVSQTIRQIEESVIFAVQARDENGCRAYDERKVFVNRANHVEVPSAFTPNGDRINDLLSVFGTPGTIVNQFTVYSKEGHRLFIRRSFSTNDTKAGWDGTFRGIDLPIDEYIWTCTVTFPDGRVNSFKGNIQLLR